MRAIIITAALLAHAAAAVEPVALGSRLELFADDHLVEKTEGLSIQLHRPEPREVVLTADAPWEGNTSGYFGVFRDGEGYRMYYRGWQHDPANKRNQQHEAVSCVALSKDGIHWKKPKLGLYAWEGSKDNNIVLMGEAATHNFTVFKDSNPECPAAARYKALGYGKGNRGLMAYQSADGFRWKAMQDKPVLTAGAFDSQNLGFFDRHRGEYRAYWRHFVNGVRAIRTATSKDFVTWGPHADLRFPAGTPNQHLYTNAVQPYFRAPHLFIGFPTRYLPKQGERVEPIFMLSRDGLLFKRYNDPVVPEDAPAGRKGNRSNYMAWGMLELPDRPNEISVYATEAYYGAVPGRIRRFVYRTDGFVSLHAGARGELVTRPFTFAGSRLLMNYRLHEGGSIRVELQDAEGRAIRDYALADAVAPAERDAVAGRVLWRDSTNLGNLAGRAVRLRVVLEKADLYAFRFAAGERHPPGKDVFAKEKWYREAEAKEQVFEGVLRREKNPGPTTGRFNPVRLDREGEKTLDVYLGGDTRALDAYLGRKVRITGKRLLMLRRDEIWPARINAQ